MSRTLRNLSMRMLGFEHQKLSHLPRSSKISNAIILLAIGVMSILLAGCAVPKQQTAKIWPATISTNEYVFPEDQLLAPELLEKGDFGIAFSGGGTRSAAATMGQLRALKHLEMLDKVGFVSALSGGSWTVIPWIYLPEDYTDEEFLGAYYEPEKLTREIVNCKGNTVDGECIGHGSMTRVISSSHITRKMLFEWLTLSRDESYSRAVGKIFLKPFGIYSPNQSFSWDDNTAQRIADQNPASIDKSMLVIPEHRGRPYPIVNATFIPSVDGRVASIYPLEITPHYVGSRFETKVMGPFKKVLIGKQKCKNFNQSIGGGYVDAFAYDSKTLISPENKQRDSSDGSYPVIVQKTKDQQWFSLADAIGASGAAPQETLQNRQGQVFDLGFHRTGTEPAGSGL
jgi:hypothetical protein